MPKTLADIADYMRDVDFTMLSTKSPDGGIAARPMSNNRDVDYDGDSWFEQGVDTPGPVLIRVRADRVHCWDGEDQGEVKTTRNATSPATS